MTSIRSSSGVSSTSSILHCISDLETHDIPEEHSSIATSSNPSCPESPRLHHPDVLIAVSEPDQDDEEEESDADECHSIYSGGVNKGSKEHSPHGHYSPERGIWENRLAGTDNPAFDADFAREVEQRSVVPTTSKAHGKASGESQPRGSHFGRKHFLMRDQVVGPQHSSSSDSGSTDDATGHDAYVNRGGGRDNERGKAGNILDFILTDASMEAS